MSFDDCLLFLASFLVAPRSADALPEFTTAIRSRLEADADVLMPTECAGEIRLFCLDDADEVEDGLPLRNSDFNLIILTVLRLSLHSRKQFQLSLNSLQFFN